MNKGAIDLPKSFKQLMGLVLMGILVAPTALEGAIVYAQSEDISPIESVEFGQPSSSSSPSEETLEDERMDEEIKEETEEESSDQESAESLDEDATATDQHPAIDLMKRLGEMQTGIVSDYTVIDYLDEGGEVLARTSTLIKDGNHYLLTDQQDQKVPQTALIAMNEETHQIEEIYEPVKDLMRNVNHATEQGFEEGMTSELEALTGLTADQMNALSDLYIDQTDQQEEYQSLLEHTEATSDFLFLLGERFINQPGRTEQLEEVAPEVYQLEITDELLEELKQLIEKEKDQFESVEDVASLFENGQASTMLFNTAAMEYGIGTLSQQSAIEYYFSAQGKSLRLPTSEQVVSLDELLNRAHGDVEEANEETPLQEEE